MSSTEAYGILQLVLEYGAEFREGFVIGAWLVGMPMPLQKHR